MWEPHFLWMIENKKGVYYSETNEFLIYLSRTTDKILRFYYTFLCLFFLFDRR